MEVPADSGDMAGILEGPIRVISIEVDGAAGVVPFGIVAQQAKLSRCRIIPVPYRTLG